MLRVHLNRQKDISAEGSALTHSISHSLQHGWRAFPHTMDSERFFLAFFALVISLSLVSTKECRYERLPTSFDGTGYLEYNQEIHLHSQYLVNFTTAITKIDFTLTDVSVTRFYLAPHRVDMDIVLLNSNTGMEVSSYDQMEDMVSGTFTKGEYSLILRKNSDAEALLECEAVTLEVAIVPLSVQRNRVNAGTSRYCVGGYSYPTAGEIFSPLAQGEVMSIYLYSIRLFSEYIVDGKSSPDVLDPWVGREALEGLVLVQCRVVLCVLCHECLLLHGPCLRCVYLLFPECLIQL